MAKEKIQVCKECGRFTTERTCPSCGCNQFIEKYKGKVYVVDPKRSKVAAKLSIKDKGMYALKHG
ncbi:DNA-directed RNA polymerase subunit E'' [Candidatus Woesearchaeota archaeon]|nr:DNA-directed RNA polymerase subunit E'' [Nanoarchaeota archaeon]MCB9371022.1 DNA-directed RNA polymerase subunit E'' [Candidatus Woesearchaeota archaeon]USN44133.1 MAG: DNA-directed RNA polymerase subunit E'' [Candidatus Woesearchaeota archaeon]